MEATVRLFRVLANRSRIRVLRLLTVLGEQHVLAVADALGCPVNTVSWHLSQLAATGLVRRRRSGVMVYYRIAEAPTDIVVRESLKLLAEAFRPVKSRKPSSVASADQRQSQHHRDDALFALFTAFTHVRRLQILRHLSQRGSATAPDLCEELQMSIPAAIRHLGKLESRDIVVRSRVGTFVVHRLVTDRLPHASRLVRAVVSNVRQVTPRP